MSDSLRWFAVDKLVVPVLGMKANRETEAELHPFSGSAPDGGKWPAWRLGRFTPGEEPIVSIVQEAGWNPEPVWKFRRSEHFMCIALASGTIYVYAHRYILSCMLNRIPYRICPPVYLIVYAYRYTLSCMPNPCTLSWMPTGIPYCLCPPVNIIAYVHLHILSCMPSDILYRVCPPVYLIEYVH